jgi:hypothetical protein
MGRPPRFAGHDPVDGDLEVGEGGEQLAEERPDWLLSRTWPIATKSSTWAVVWPVAPCLRRVSALTLRKAAFADAARAA